MGRGIIVMMLVFGFVSSMMTMRAQPLRSVSETNQSSLPSSGDSARPGEPAGGEASNNGDSVELTRSDDGHFYADVEINGAKVRALVDTGATGIALSRDDARAAGVATSISMPEVVGKGADGDVRGEVVMLDRVALGGTSAEGLPAIILNSGEQSLLGQSFLSRFRSVRIEGDRMILE